MDRRLIPNQSDWPAMRANFSWSIPARFNIAQAACDDWATMHPDRIAISHLNAEGRVENWTYGALKRASDRLAIALEGRGLKRGDRIAILMPQHPMVMIAHFAAMKLGAISLPIFAAFGADALEYRLKDSGAKVVITEYSQIDKLMSIRGSLPDLTCVYSINGGGRDIWGDIDAAHGHFRRLDTDADEPAMMIYTSGTTGPPKGVLHAHRFLIGHLPSIETSHEGFPRPGDKGWTPADWAWIGGLMDMAMPCLFYGVPLLCHRMERFDPQAAFDLIDRFGLKNLFVPPTALKLMRADGGRPKMPLRSVSSGGESLGADLIEWGLDAFRSPINEIYGQTECNLIAAHTGTTMQRRSGTMGQAVPGFDIALLTADGTKVADGEMGEIAVKRPNPVMFLKYWNKPEETAKKFNGDWLMTGDLATIDREGYLTYHGRNDDVITSAGYRIGPTEIENCLTAHPQVLMAAAIGMPDEFRGQVVHALVTLKGEEPKGLEEDLIALVRERISPHVAPKKITVIRDMPLTTTGKIMRRELRRLYS